MSKNIQVNVTLSEREWLIYGNLPSREKSKIIRMLLRRYEQEKDNLKGLLPKTLEDGILGSE